MIVIRRRGGNTYERYKMIDAWMSNKFQGEVGINFYICGIVFCYICGIIFHNII
jgi:hypothetical protein